MPDAWGDIAHREHVYTPTGGQVATIQAMALRAFADGTTPSDALLIDLLTGTGDLRKGATTMASAATVDLGSAPFGKVAITGAVNIASFGPGKHLDRIVRFVDGGATLIQNATSLDLPGRANIVTRAGDRLHATSDSAGNWRVNYYTRADGSLVGFTPVQQGTGTGQLPGNAVKIGWNGNSLLATVDNLNLGRIWTDYEGGQSLATNGYKRLPGGLTLQWGTNTPAGGDQIIPFPVAFSGPALNVIGTPDANGAPIVTLYAAEIDLLSTTGFALRGRYVNNGGQVGVAAIPIRWVAIGPT